MFACLLSLVSIILHESVRFIACPPNFPVIRNFLVVTGPEPRYDSAALTGKQILSCARMSEISSRSLVDFWVLNGQKCSLQLLPHSGDRVMNTWKPMEKSRWSDQVQVSGWLKIRDWSWSIASRTKEKNEAAPCFKIIVDFKMWNTRCQDQFFVIRTEWIGIKHKRKCVESWVSESSVKSL